MRRRRQRDVVIECSAVHGAMSSKIGSTNRPKHLQRLTIYSAVAELERPQSVVFAAIAADAAPKGLSRAEWTRRFSAVLDAMRGASRSPSPLIRVRDRSTTTPGRVCDTNSPNSSTASPVQESREHDTVIVTVCAHWIVDRHSAARRRRTPQADVIGEPAMGGRVYQQRGSRSWQRPHLGRKVVPNAALSAGRPRRRSHVPFKPGVKR